MCECRQVRRGAHVPVRRCGRSHGDCENGELDSGDSDGELGDLRSQL